MRKAVAAVVAGIALVAGCGGESGSAQPVAERWDPCSIPQDAIAGTGLDPSSMDVGLGDGIEIADWSRCRFRGPTARPSYFFSISSSEAHTIDEAREDQIHADGVDVAIGEHDAYRYKTTLFEEIENCNVAVAVSSGVVIFSVESMSTLKIGADPCDLVAKHASDLEPLLPPANK